VVALLGDIGGTNVRLTLRRLNLKTRTSEEIKPLTKFESQKVGGIDDAIKQFLAVSIFSPPKRCLIVIW
jgi:glucokinase